MEIEIELEVENSMKERLIDAVLDWPSQARDFERDGSLRDFYVQEATVDDWRVVVAQVLDGDYCARLELDGVAVQMPDAFETVFGGEDGSRRYFMTFTVGDVVVDCHFFIKTEIEFSFEPTSVTALSLRALLRFMIDVGEATRKSVIMSPENCPESPLFRYKAIQPQLRWLSTSTSIPRMRVLRALR